MHTIQIGLSPYGVTGWQWIQYFTDPLGERTRGGYRTNQHGAGLWRVYETQDKQILGTCQFSLSASHKNAYQQIRRWIVQSNSITT